MNSTRSTTSHFCRKTIGRWSHSLRLQHPKGVHTSSCTPFERRYANLRQDPYRKNYHSKLNHLILLKMLRPRSRIRKAFLQISNVSSLLENNWKMEELFLIITSKKSLLFTLYFVSVEVCKFLSKH